MQNRPQKPFFDRSKKNIKMNWNAFFEDNKNFEVWNAEHFIWLGLGVISWIFWINLGKKQADLQGQIRVAKWMTALPILCWFYFLIVILLNKSWNWSNVIPFHLCYFLNLLMPLVVVARKKWLFDGIYFWVMAGCLQALLTPDLETAFPGYFSIKYWPVHLALIGSVLYAIFVYKWKPKYVGIYWALIGGNLFVGFLTIFNKWLGTNFMYTELPAKGSILEKLGEHYLLASQPLALLLFHVVYLPFLIQNYLEKNKKSA
jgi:hypothetical integral membrane protein (TIGR02206 family)